MSTAAATTPADEKRTEAQAPGSGLVPGWATGLLGFCLLAIGLAIVYLLVKVWPVVQAATSVDHKGPLPTVTIFGRRYAPTEDTSLLLLVIVTSALGSYVHAATSFTDYVGNRKLMRSWLWWYVMRGFIGTALAVLFYFAVRGGFLGANAPAKDINPYGIGAVAGLVGLFSKQATDKLREVFDTLFRTAPGGGDDVRGDSIANPRPSVAGLEPPRWDAGPGVAEITLRGDGFLPDSVVAIDRGGELLQRDVVYRGPTELLVKLRAGDVAEAGTIKVVVTNSAPGGGSSAPAVLEVVAPQ